MLAVLLAAGAFLLSPMAGGPSRGWVAWFCLLPLFLGIRVLPPAGALGAGAFWGACLFAFHSASDSGTALSGPAPAALLVVVPALYAFGGALLTRFAGFHPLLLGLGWVGVEFALEPLGLGYGLLAGTQGHGPLFQLFGSLVGYVFIAFVIASVNAVLFRLLSDTVLPDDEHRRPSTKRPLSLLAPDHHREPRSLSPARASRPRAPPGATFAI
jgi:apolipoprotein N-acyltransferase